MTFDPDAPHAHDATAPEDPARRGERPPTKARRGPANDDEQAAAAAMAELATKNLGGWSATFVASVAAQIASYGPRLTESQWAHAIRVARENGMLKSAAPAPIPESPEAEALKAEIRAGEARLDALLADPDGPRCLSRESGGVFGQCGTCGLELGPGQAKRANGRELIGKDFAVCVALPWLAERRAKLAQLRGDETLAREVRESMGLARPAAPANVEAKA